MGKLAGKAALVTGANRGIGLGIARGLAREGAALTIAARGEAELARAAEELGSLGANVLAVPVDVTDESQIIRLFEESHARHGRLDVLVNNAGAFDGAPLDAFSTAAWDKVLSVNLRAPFLCTREAMKVMKRQGTGRIINIGSISAQRVRPNSAAYSASKFGLWGLTQVTALEGRDHGITCCCLHPGNVRVERRATERPEDAEPMIEIDELAEVAVLMATLPPHVEMLEAIVMPRDQQYIGRG